VSTTSPVSEADTWNQLVSKLESADSAPDESTVQTAQAAVDAARAAFGGKSEQLAYSLERLAEIQHALGNLEAAEKGYREALEVVKTNTPPDIVTIARLGRILGLLCEYHGRDDEAMAYFDEAVPLLLQLYGPTYPGLISMLNNSALAHKKKGDTKRAEKLFLEAVSIADKIHPSEHADQALVLNNLGNLYTSIGDYEQAENVLIRALGIRQRLFGQRHPDVAQTLSNIAVLHHYNRRWDNAHEYYERALNVLLNQATLDPDEIAIVAENFCQLLEQRGRKADADKLAADVNAAIADAFK
jgi:tetratricopeptide (TPR) repeat protein